MSQNHPISKEEILKLIEYLEKPLEFYEDPVYTTQEKEAIQKFEHLAFEFCKSLKKDGYITFSKRDKKEEERVAIFTKIIVDISNKLARTTEFNAEEGWFIILSLYCWVCEMIKNSLSDVAIKIYRNLESREWKGFMTMTPFVKTMSRYKNRKYAFLFSEIDVDLRNSFVHGKIQFPYIEIEYRDSDNQKKQLKLEAFLTKYKKIAPLYATLFLYRRKIFVDEIRVFAKSKGFL